MNMGEAVEGLQEFWRVKEVEAERGDKGWKGRKERMLIRRQSKAGAVEQSSGEETERAGAKESKGSSPIPSPAFPSERQEGEKHPSLDGGAGLRHGVHPRAQGRGDHTET
ncbi:hypothetical protein IE53DRAFT_381963 [Violaceomyces palustris]|uniref:Uncharacterized protein n=1 Tax=Violaceomyces palustris TaxID=1673888 RepID=A0ACD0NP89_9BASI|nr:hypothetical protein IE53DRAFT_381963 [Violaceomyces palustris]